jgi:two-component system sensor histidine kinase CpxA
LLRDFNHMAERLESLVGAQQLLLRDVSHELRSPLARLSVALELAREDGSPETAKHLNRMERETEKLNQLIGQLLTLSSIEAIENIERFESTSLNEIVVQMLPDAQYEASQRQCSVAFHAKDECTVQGNRQLLYRAIENVLRNAIQYTNQGTGVEIRVAAERDAAGQPVSVVEVSDHGPGIPEAETEAIFRPFYRVDRARSQETGGFGVGLAIAERTVKLHGGYLSGHNRSGGGVTIRMEFPLANAASGGHGVRSNS